MLGVIDYILYIFGNTLHLHLNSLRKKKTYILIHILICLS